MQGAPAPHQTGPVFPGCHVGYSLRLERGQHLLWLTRVGAATCKCATEGPDESESNLPRASPSRCQPPLLLGPVFPGCHRKRVITPP